MRFHALCFGDRRKLLCRVSLSARYRGGTLMPDQLVTGVALWRKRRNATHQLLPIYANAVNFEPSAE